MLGMLGDGRTGAAGGAVSAVGIASRARYDQRGGWCIMHACRDRQCSITYMQFHCSSALVPNSLHQNKGPALPFLARNAQSGTRQCS